MKNMFVSTMIISIWLLPNIVLAGPDRGALLSMSCAACHGTDGKSPGAMPSLYGKSSKYIEKSLLRFQKGEKKGTVMNRIAKGYSEEEIKVIASFFGKLGN
ncbi:MAG TPA: cytochrome c [SAR324 cluster bacterium]|jgi:sulfide dehydrogenase cytochrome subunit|nr:hypothetical protein [Pseudomonadota bacterium]MEE1577112.1 cytochrome c [Deltaproteobacteria bacterium]HCP33522.1 hypothetical protein [Deltaproteobacteria bacterium]HJL85803.1 cytochrome c [SAR324 cluster bacterium]|tara:strand:- start:2278 stop:2580 length:303 start_codon:yes stop_codon:yes gene_type:complete